MNTEYPTSCLEPALARLELTGAADRALYSQPPPSVVELGNVVRSACTKRSAVLLKTAHAYLIMSRRPNLSHASKFHAAEVGSSAPLPHSVSSCQIVVLSNCRVADPMYLSTDRLIETDECQTSRVGEMSKSHERINWRSTFSEASLSVPAVATSAADVSRTCRPPALWMTHSPVPIVPTNHGLLFLLCFTGRRESVCLSGT